MDELKRGGFVFYYSYFEALEVLPEELKEQFFNGVMEYAFYGKEPDFNDLALKMAFKLVKGTMDSSNNRYDACVQNGKKGGAPKGNTNAKKKTTKETTREQAKNNQTFNQTNNLKTTLMNKNMNTNMNMNNSDSYSNPHSKDRIPLDAETTLQESGDYMSDYQTWRLRQLSDYEIKSVGGDCYQTTIGSECIIIDDSDFRAAFENGKNVNDYVAEKEGM